MCVVLAWKYGFILSYNFEIELISFDDSYQEDINEEYEESTLSEEEFYGSKIDSDGADNDFLLI